MRSLLLAVLVLACALPATAKDKKKKDQPLPDAVLKANAVVVTVDPEAGASLSNPMEQNQARRAVESALRKWGHFQVLTNAPASSDYIVIEVRKGGGARPTVSGGPVNERVPSIDASNGSIYVDTGGLHNGPLGSPRSSAEYSSQPDSFIVYLPIGDHETPVWRYAASGCLDGPRVKAVEEFKKAFTESEKAQAERQNKKP